MFYRVSLRAYDNKQNDWLPAEEISLSRILAYDDTQVLAKEQEEALLYKDMRSDAVGQAMRRLNRAKPQPSMKCTMRISTEDLPQHLAKGLGLAVRHSRRGAAARHRGRRCHPRGRARSGLQRTRSADRRTGLQVGGTAQQRAEHVAVFLAQSDRSAHPFRQARRGRRTGAAGPLRAT